MTKFTRNMAALKLLTMMLILHTSSAVLYCEDEAERKEEAERKSVAFTVRFVSDDSINGITIKPSQVLIFDDVVTNIGGGYDSCTGIFTAPVAGYYVLHLNAMSTNGRRYVVLAIDKHGTILAKTFGNGKTDPEDQSSTQVVIHLTAGEEVWVRQHAGDAVRGGTWTVFTGFLIFPD